MAETRNAYNILVGKSLEKWTLGRREGDRRTILRRILQKL